MQENKKSTITLELLDQGGITLHYDELLHAIKSSIPYWSMVMLANSVVALREKTLLAWAIWKGEQIQGFVLTQPAVSNYSGSECMVIYAICGQDMEIADWSEAITHLSNIIKPLGYSRLAAITDSPRVLEIINHTGWTIKSFCEKEL